MSNLYEPIEEITLISSRGLVVTLQKSDVVRLTNEMRNGDVEIMAEIPEKEWFELSKGDFDDNFVRAVMLETGSKNVPKGSDAAWS